MATAAIKSNDIFERIETKYLMSMDTYRSFLEETVDQIQADEYGDSKILNIYFDNDRYDLVRRSMERPRYKEKLRLRSYGVPTDDTTAFLEIKKKYEGIVYKRRVEIRYADAYDYLTGGYKKGQIPDVIKNTQIGREIDYFVNLYRVEPKFFIGYGRIACYSLEDPTLRLTFDTRLRYRQNDLDLRKGDAGVLYDGGRMVLMEIKAGGAYPLWLTKILDELKIYPASFSKYGSVYAQTYANVPISSYINTLEPGRITTSDKRYRMPARPVAI